MGKHVIVIASGETERRALPHLVAYLQDENVSVESIRIPPRNMALKVQMAERLIKSAWYESVDRFPDKFVLLVDLDGKSADEALKPFQEQLPSRLGSEIKATVQFAYARRHLEAWYFADSTRLRGYLGGALGHVDASQPDEIQNPKLHLKNLIGDRRLYTARVSEEIASKLDAQTIARRSPSFSIFVEAVRNGNVSRPKE